MPVDAEEVTDRLRLLAALYAGSGSQGRRVEWPRPEAWTVLERLAASPAPLYLAEVELVRLADAFGVPGWALVVEHEAWNPIQTQVSTLAALRRHDEQWIITLSEARNQDQQVGEEPSEFAWARAWAELQRAPRCSRTGWAAPPTGADTSMPSPRSETELLKRCERLVAELDEAVGLPENSLQAFIQRFSEHRGRRIVLRAFRYGDTVEGECGLFIARTDHDEIGYPIDAPHASHIVFHEIGHMVCGHRGSSSPEASPLMKSMSLLDPDMVRSVLGRTVYSEEVEREAELFASLMSSRFAVTRAQDDGRDFVTDPITLRVRGTFGG